MFQVEISLRVERPKILLPIGLIGFTTQNIAEPDLLGPGADEGCISLRIPEVQMQFRIHDYYMGVLSAVLAERSIHICIYFRNVLEHGHNYRQYLSYRTCRWSNDLLSNLPY